MVVLTAVAAGYGIYSFVQGVRNGSISCLPADFPRYPGAIYARFSFDLNGAYPGNTCHAVFESNADAASVTTFYQGQLNIATWQVTSIDNQADTISFQPARTTAPFGTVKVAATGTNTEITIDLFTATCLPLNFPVYPGAKFEGQNVDVGGTYGCHVVLVSYGSIAAINAFYVRELNTGNWRVTSSSAGQVSFRLRNGKMTVRTGTVTIGVRGDGAEIKVDA